MVSGDVNKPQLFRLSIWSSNNLFYFVYHKIYRKDRKSSWSLHHAVCWKRNAVPLRLPLTAGKPQVDLQAHVDMHQNILLSWPNPLQCQQLSE